VGAILGHRAHSRRNGLTRLSWLACTLAAAAACSGGEIEAPAAEATRNPPGGRSDGNRFDNPGRPAAESGEDAGADEDAGAPAEMGGCGDGELQNGESCDDGNNKPGDGCAADCRTTEQNYVCPSPGEACVSSVKCGDGKISGKETCDDGDADSADGCDDDCSIEPGWTCPGAGEACRAARCGDGIVAGDEQCEDDDDPPSDGDGCNAQCKLEAGSVCPQPKAACRPTSCNDGMREGSEACDDGNQTLGDGCTPFCEVEPDCGGGACKSRCGDGLLLPSDPEACDDGNTRDGDGCSANCEVESGYSCSREQMELPDTLEIPITYRDFISIVQPDSGATRHPDFELFFGTEVTQGLVAERLGDDGKPVYTGLCDDAGQPYPDPAPGSGQCPNNQMTTSAGNFEQWYRDRSEVNVSKVERLRLQRDAQSGLYRFGDAAFFPWDGDANSQIGRGLEQAYEEHDFGFTSEVRYYFEYRAEAQNPATLSFSGDDDVWVFINRHLAVDLGGVHGERSGSVTLDEGTASRLEMESGRIYEIALFHAERKTWDSNFNLTLGGFAAARSDCSSRCGDGIAVAGEGCDDGKNDGSYGSCTSDCRRAAWCGDGKRDQDHEACDDGVNITTYGAEGKPGCAPGCKHRAFCGDERVDSFAGEECDDGENPGGYNQCGRDCHLGPRCGDGIRQREDGEDCDDKNLIGGDGCSKSCKREQPQ
jgi:fibro-slime domain-containing protein